MDEKEKEAAVKKLTDACNTAFDTYPDSCSHSVWHVIRQYDPDQKFKLANNLVQYLKKSPRWKEVQIPELNKLANEGVLVVGGAQSVGHGHVIVVYPGPVKHSGFYYDKNGKLKEIRSRGIYPRAMSTSSGDWPGCMSKGDLTIIDCWGTDDFREVKFWKYVGNSAKHEKAHKKEAGK